MPIKPASIAHPYVLLIITTLAWGGNAIAGKLAVDHVSPFLLTLLRWALACILMLPFALPHLKRDWAVIKQNLIFLCLLGSIGFAVFNNLMYLALTYTSAINVAIEQASMPLVVFVLNYILFRTNVTAFQVIGFAITLIGVALTVTRGNLFALGNQPLNFGDLLMVGAIMVYGIYTVFLRNKPQIHVLSFLMVLALAAFFATIPFAVFEHVTDTLQWPDVQGWGVVVYAALFPSVVAQLFWVMGLEKIGSNRGGLFINLVPIFGALLAVIILGEAFELYHAIGLGLVLGGIALAQRPSASRSL
ncbi:MAG: DMT family transporter [Pseudomonadota bacterium]